MPHSNTFIHTINAKLSTVSMNFYFAFLNVCLGYTVCGIVRSEKSSHRLIYLKMSG